MRRPPGRRAGHGRPLSPGQAPGRQVQLTSACRWHAACPQREQALGGHEARGGPHRDTKRLHRGCSGRPGTTGHALPLGLSVLNSPAPQWWGQGHTQHWRQEPEAWVVPGAACSGQLEDHGQPHQREHRWVPLAIPRPHGTRAFGLRTSLTTQWWPSAWGRGWHLPVAERRSSDVLLLSRLVVHRVHCRDGADDGLQGGRTVRPCGTQTRPRPGSPRSHRVST